MVAANCFIIHANQKGKLCLIIKSVTRPFKSKALKSVIMSILLFWLVHPFFYGFALSCSVFSMVLCSFTLVLG